MTELAAAPQGGAACPGPLPAPHRDRERWVFGPVGWKDSEPEEEISVDLTGFTQLLGVAGTPPGLSERRDPTDTGSVSLKRQGVLSPD